MAPFVHRHRVRYHEVDAHEHVYNARYLEYVDAAMIELLRDLGWSFNEAVALGFDPLLARAQIDFRRAAVFDEQLEIAVSPLRLGRSSLELSFAVRTSAGEAIADIIVVYVNVDPAESGATPIPSLVRAELERRLTTAATDV